MGGGLVGEGGSSRGATGQASQGDGHLFDQDFLEVEGGGNEQRKASVFLLPGLVF